MTASLQGEVKDTQGSPVPGATVIVSRGKEAPTVAISDAEGIFRLLNLPPGAYQVDIEKDGFRSQSYSQMQLRAGELLTMELRLEGTGPANARAGKGPLGIPGAPPRQGESTAADLTTAYPGLRKPAVVNLEQELVGPELLSNDKVFSRDPDRWNVEMPEWSRYGRPGEFPYTESHWYDPFNRNRLKGDKPIFGQDWFLNLTAQSIT
ncbi:MAG: carboxypeptidase-like regulatory domain-containing protein, partial [Mycobacterium sp.]